MGWGIVESDLVPAPPGDTLGAEGPPWVIYLEPPQVREALHSGSSALRGGTWSCLVVQEEGAGGRALPGE